MGGSSKQPSHTTQTVTQSPGPLELAAAPHFQNLLSRGSSTLSKLLGPQDAGVDPQLLSQQAALQRNIQAHESANASSGGAHRRIHGADWDKNISDLSTVNRMISEQQAKAVQAQSAGGQDMGFSPLELQARDRMMQFINTQLPQLRGQFEGLRGRLSGLKEFTDPGETFGRPLEGLIAPFDPGNQVTQDLLRATLNPMRTEFTEILRPQLSSQDVLTQGGPGGTRGQVLQGQLGERYLNSIGDVTARLMAQQQEYQNTLAQQVAQLLESQQMGRVGVNQSLIGSEQGILQQLLGIDQLGPQLMQSLGQDQTFREMDILQRYANILGATQGGTPGPTTTTGMAGGGGSGRTGGLVGGAGGALSGAALGSQIFPGWGTAIGALLGGITGGFA